MIATVMIAQSAGPFTPGQRTLILIAAAVAYVLALWFCPRGVRSFWHRHEQNFRFLALSLLLLICAGEGLVVLYALDVVKQHPLWLPTAPMIATVLYLVAARYDERNKVSKDLESGHPLTRLISPYLRFSPRRPHGHFGALLAFYLGSENVSIATPYARSEALLRLKRLDEMGEIEVTERPGDKLMACSTRVRGNILPLFTGRLLEENGTTRLDGRIEIDRGIVFVLGMFCFAIWIFFPMSLLFHIGSRSPAGLTDLFMPIIWLGMLEFFYFASKDSAAIILRNLERALSR
jgi:hypothetical protein